LLPIQRAVRGLLGSAPSLLISTFKSCTHTRTPVCAFRGIDSSHPEVVEKIRIEAAYFENQTERMSGVSAGGTPSICCSPSG
jgi:hypothetical protein